MKYLADHNLMFLYYLYNKKRKLIYVGITDSLKNRLSTHKINLRFSYFKYEIGGQIYIRKKERSLIRQYEPEFNILLYKRKIYNRKAKNTHTGSKINHKLITLYDEINLKIDINYNLLNDYVVESSLSRGTISDIYNYKGVSFSTLLKCSNELNIKIKYIINNKRLTLKECTQFLREQRIKKNYTQKEVAEILNISRQKYIDFEKIKHYDFILLDQVAGLVGYDLNLTI